MIIQSEKVEVCFLLVNCGKLCEMPRFQVKKRKREFSGGRKNQKQFVSKPNAETESDDVFQPRPRPTCDSIDNAGGPSPKQSSSAKKVKPKLTEYNMYRDENGCNDIINLKNLGNLLGQIAMCVKCQGSLTVSTGHRIGLSVNIIIKCNDCSFQVSTLHSSVLPSQHSEINVRTAYAFRCIGKGEEAAKTFCALMNLPTPSAFKYSKSILCNAAKEVCLTSMKDAVEESVNENGGKRDLTVIFDGTWQRRGHSSLNGVVSAIGANTGKVIDVRVFSKYCRCTNRLQNEHTADCISNYSGVSGGMEVRGVLDMFQQSLPKYNVRYVNYLGDGDSASYPAVVSAKPYGPEVSIEKLECIGHVQKRMGSRLRKLKTKLGKTNLSDGKPIGGRGRLTNASINEIQIYYGLAIRRNTSKSLEEMKQAVWAEFFHLGSSNEHPAHELCPKGHNSWCKYQKAVLNNEKYDHNQHTHLPQAVMDEIKPIFKDLAHPDLLRKCLHGGTQNPSESLNSVIWSRISKSTFVLKSTLELGVHDAVASFNNGNIAKCQILSCLGISPGNNCVDFLKKADELRIKKADKSVDEIEKKVRQAQHLARKKLEDMYEEAEDPDRPSYGAGMY